MRALYFVATIVIFGVIFFNIYNDSREFEATSEDPIEFSYNQFIDHIESGKVAKVKYRLENDKISGELIAEEGKEPTQFITDNPQVISFKQYLLEKDVKVVADSPESEGGGWLFRALGSVLHMVVWMGILFVVIVFGSRYIMKSTVGFTDMEISAADVKGLTFDKVAGNDEAKDDMKELVDFLKSPQKYKRYGAKIPRGTILFGPPGTGKTLLAKALAGTAGVPFYALSGSDFVEKYVGVGASRVRKLFAEARKNAPCIIFIDELDAVGKRRDGGSRSNDERDQTLNQILVEMDGFSGNEGVIVIAATNRLDSLDQALLRSGRFDRQIYVGLPDLEAREEILHIHAGNKPLDAEVDLKVVAKMTTGMSGADLENVMNEAGIYAARNNHESIMMADIDRAINKLRAGDEKKRRSGISKREREIIAYHEAGHALTAKLVANRSVPKVTIIPTTKGAGGYTLIEPQEKMLESKEDLDKELIILLGGRAAEEIVYGKDRITGGASGDLRQATNIALRMVKQYGMSENVGLVSVDTLYGAQSISADQLIADEVKNIIGKAYEAALKEVRKHKDALSRIAEALLEKETIYEAELDEVLNEN